MSPGPGTVAAAGQARERGAEGSACGEWRPADLLATAFVALAAAATYWGLLWHVFGDDAIIHRYPFAALISRAWQRGELPLWNPFSWSGTPFVADISADLWYPLNVLYAVLPLDLAFRAFGMTHVVAGGLAAYVCARCYELGRWGATAAGLVYGLGAPTFHAVYSGYLILVSGFPYLPLAVGLAHRALERRRPRMAAAAGVALGLQVLGAHVQLAAITMVALAVQAFVHVLNSADRRRECRVSAWYLLGALSVGALIGAPKLVPFAYYARDGVLLHGIGNAGASAAARLRDFYEASCAGFSPLAWSQVFVPDPGYSLVTPAYVGAAALALAAAGLCGAASGTRRVSLVALGGAGLLAGLGLYSPVHWLLFWAPGGQFLRRPERYLILFTLATAVLAGMGVERLRADPGAVRRSMAAGWRRPGTRWGVFGLLLITAAAAGLAATTHGWVADRVRSFWWQHDYAGLMKATAHPQTTPAEGLEAAVAALDAQWARLTGSIDVAGALLAAGALALASLALWGAGRRMGPGVTGMVCIGAVVWGCVALHVRYVPPVGYFSSPREYFARGAAMDTILQDTGSFRVLTVGPGNDHPLPSGVVRRNQGMVDGFEDLHGLSNYTSRRYVALMNLIDGQDPALLPRRPFDVRVDGPGSALLDLLNVRYALSPEPLVADGYELVVEEPSGLRLYRNANEGPRAFLAPSWRSVGNLPEALSRLSEAGFAPRREAVVEGEMPAGWESGSGSPEGSVQVTGRSLGALELQTESPARALCVISQGYASGWRAWVDDVPTRLLCADAALQAVPVPAGRHRVSLRFRPVTVWVGLAMGLAGVGAATLMAVADRRGTS